jgi:hypothetical protein
MKGMAGLDWLENLSELLKGEADLSTEMSEGMLESVNVAHAEVVAVAVGEIKEEACFDLLGYHD